MSVVIAAGTIITLIGGTALTLACRHTVYDSLRKYSVIEHERTELISKSPYHKHQQIGWPRDLYDVPGVGPDGDMIRTQVCRCRATRDAGMRRWSRILCTHRIRHPFARD